MGDDDLYNEQAETTASVAVLESKTKRNSRATYKVRETGKLW